MSKMVTRCPQCQTSFKVTEEHLKIANGAVRCGSCLHVFQARLHWVNPETATTAQTTGSQPVANPQLQAALSPATETPAAPVARPASKFVFDQAAIDNSSAEDILDAPAPRAAQPAPTTAPKAPQKSLDDIGDDDLISDDMLGDDDDDVPAKGSAAHARDFGDPDDDYGSLFDEVNAEEEAHGDDGLEALLSGDFNDLDNLDQYAVPDNSVQDESWAKELLSEAQEEDKPEELDLSQVEDIRDLLVDFTNPADVDAARRDLGLDADPFAVRELTGNKRAPGNKRADMIAHIEPAPVELVAARYESPSLKPLLMQVLIATVLVGVALVQYLFFNFEQLARSDSMRPVMASLCNTLGCQLPDAESWRNVRISNLVVRQHPQVADALSIDAILLNTSSRALAFPSLEMYFNDMRNVPVASRRFSPAEYLAGELAGQTQMPPGAPVHIAFDIVSPDSGNLNWNLQVSKVPN
ncbi:MAG TPA: DUF3426 domain-containing protein [Pseudomonadales bacterium]|nr:DUF3426 domain-containing protein [Pseudomonadales bacterium]